MDKVCRICETPIRPGATAICVPCSSLGRRDQAFDNFKWAVINIVVRDGSIRNGFRMSHVDGARIFNRAKAWAITSFGRKVSAMDFAVRLLDQNSAPVAG